MRKDASQRTIDTHLPTPPASRAASSKSLQAGTSSKSLASVDFSTTSSSAFDWHAQIDKDLHRTFPGHLSMDDSGRTALKNILLAYSVWSPLVGYCQGMNFIVGVLLLFMDEEDAFWCLSALVEDRLPGYFSVAMVAPQVDQLVLRQLVSEHLPTLADALQRHGLDVIGVSMQWFLCVYINSLPLETALRVWDVLFFDASPVILFRVALALLDVYSKVQ